MTQQFTWDHTVEFVNDLKSAERTFADAGLTSRYGGKHVGHGTENSLAYFADNYLEFLALYDREEALSETPDHGLIFHEAGELLPGYVGFYRPALHVHGIEQAAERLTAKGLDLGHIVPGNRTTAAGEEIRWRLLWIKGDDRGLRYPSSIGVRANPSNWPATRAADCCTGMPSAKWTPVARFSRCPTPRRWPRTGPTCLVWVSRKEGTPTGPMSTISISMWEGIVSGASSRVNATPSPNCSTTPPPANPSM